MSAISYWMTPYKTSQNKHGGDEGFEIYKVNLHVLAGLKSSKNMPP